MSTSSPQPIGACAILLNTQGQILLGKRKNAYKAGFYGLPGGRIELNEILAEAVQREVKEEVGIQLNNLEYIGVVRENQNTYDFIHFIFIAKNVTEQPILTEPEKCEGWEWFDSGKLPDLILPGHQAAIEMFFKKEKIVDLTK